MEITSREELAKKLEEYLRDQYRQPLAQEKGVGFYVEWETGGITGGSCWGGEHQPYTSSERESDFLGLDEFLGEVKPDLTLLQYKQLLKKVKYDSYTDRSDYYGNSTDCATKFLAAEDVVSILGDWLDLPKPVIKKSKTLSRAAKKNLAKKGPKR